MQQQKGMTLIGMVLTLTIVILAGIMLMRIVPVYLNHYSVTKSIDALAHIPKEDLSADPTATARLLKTRLMNQFYVNGIYDIKAKQVTLLPDRKKPGIYDVSLAYKVTKPLVGNIRLLFEFDVKKEISLDAKH